MACKICKRSSCTESFHSIEEQELYEEKVQEVRDEIVQSIKNDLRRKLDNLDGVWIKGNYIVDYAEVVGLIEDIYY